MGEGVGRDHLNDEAGGVGCLLHLHDALVALLVRCVEVEHVIVVEGDAPRADLRELRRVLPRVEDRAGPRPKGIDRVPSDGPQAEGELVVGGGRHGGVLSNVDVQVEWVVVVRGVAGGAAHCCAVRVLARCCAGAASGQLCGRRVPCLRHHNLFVVG